VIFRFLKNSLAKRYLFLFFITLVFIASCGEKIKIKPAKGKISDLKPTVIMISLDGCRVDFLDKNLMPNLNMLASTGVKSEALIPVFPTKTFPNHYTIVTGLFPEHHGIVSNKFYDPETNIEFPGKDKVEALNGHWWGGEPIWITAQLQGQISATLFWPGAEAEIKGKRANYGLPYDKNMPYRQRVNQILEWLDLPVDKRPTLITLYIEEIDTIGHDYGPNSPKIDRALSTVDQAFQDLITGLKDRDIFEEINLVITSDHGMAQISSDKIIYLDDYIDLTQVKTLDESPLAWVWTQQEQTKEVYEKLSKAHPNLHVFLKEEIPEKYHFRNNPRIPPIVAIADEGWSVSTRGIMKSLSRTFSSGGAHGYDPALHSMQGVFIAHGSAFKKNLVVAPFENINIYNMVTKILNLKSSPNDGCQDCFQDMLK
jgi:predicted AlkP superfamily pyrophosphatase or phosphodiesterase